MRTRIAGRFATRTADEWEAALLATPAAAAKCNTLAEWIDHPQARANGLFVNAEHNTAQHNNSVAPPLRIASHGEGPTHHTRHGSEGGALAGIRVIDISSFWAGPLAARLLAELGADVIKVEPPGGEGSYRLMAGLPNIYVDGNRSKRGLILDLSVDADRRRFLDLVAASDVVVENAVAGTWERLGLDEAALRARNPTLIYSRSKGFGLAGPLASRPAFDYTVAAATGMELLDGNMTPQPVNFTANDYGTGLQLAAGTVLALLGRARGHAVTTVEASLMMTATVWQSEQAAGADPKPDPTIYEAKDGWLVVCPLTDEHRKTVDALPPDLTLDEARRHLHHVPNAVSVHPGAVPDDPQVQARGMLTTTTHAVAGRVVQVGVPLRLSADMPAVKGPAPVPVQRWAKR
jgi:crotonobetainyl-CoA:carnitine CoA-transferase CaiB-like acyl-CoA transferase